MEKIKKKWALSKSAMEKYIQCPFGFKQYYLEGIRPCITGSPLLFGCGHDAACNALLLGATEKEALQSYQDEVKKFPLGTVIPTKYDFDWDLIPEEQDEYIIASLREFGFKGTDYSNLFHSLLNKSGLSEGQRKAFDFLGRVGLEAKIRIIIPEYARTVLPNIEKVYEVQSRTESGVLDALVEWRGRGKIIIDNKAIQKPYSPNAVNYSLQLSLYAAETGVRDVAFVASIKNIDKNTSKKCRECGHRADSQHRTCNKQINKRRCGGEWEVTISPQAKIQILHGKVTDEMVEVARDAQTQIKRAIDAEIFHCNFPQCNNQYGKPCAYRDLRWKGSMDGLERYREKRK